MKHSLVMYSTIRYVYNKPLIILVLVRLKFCKFSDAIVHEKAMFTFSFTATLTFDVYIPNLFNCSPS